MRIDDNTLADAFLAVNVAYPVLPSISHEFTRPASLTVTLFVLFVLLSSLLFCLALSWFARASAQCLVYCVLAVDGCYTA